MYILNKMSINNKKKIYIAIDQDDLNYLKSLPVPHYQRIIQKILHEWIQKDRDEKRDYSFLNARNNEVLENVKHCLKMLDLSEKQLNSFFENYDRLQ